MYPMPAAGLESIYGFSAKRLQLGRFTGESDERQLAMFHSLLLTDDVENR